MKLKNKGETIMYLNLGSKIKELRLKNGRTQESLANVLGITSQAVSRWESGESYPGVDIIPIIASPMPICRKRFAR